jgi:hypothetical protein
MMKKISIVFITIFLFAINSGFNKTQSSILGAWHSQNGSIETVAVFKDGYFSYSIFDKANRKFIRTYGGTFSESGGQLHANAEFDSQYKDNVGRHSHYSFSLSGDKLTLNTGGAAVDFTRIDNSTGDLAGNWRITARMNNGEMQPMQPGPRKTLKLLSGTRFQWIAFNTETKEFSGTGGGTYTFNNGKYTENIEFFSRDSSRVGASLSFDGTVNNNVWTHKGLSSKGDPIHEKWTRGN